MSNKQNPSQKKPSEQRNNEASREKFWNSALELHSLNKILIDSQGTSPEERAHLQQQQEFLERQIKRQQDRGNPILAKVQEQRAQTKG